MPRYTWACSTPCDGVMLRESVESGEAAIRLTTLRELNSLCADRVWAVLARVRCIFLALWWSLQRRPIRFVQAVTAAPREESRSAKSHRAHSHFSPGRLCLATTHGRLIQQPRPAFYRSIFAQPPREVASCNHLAQPPHPAVSHDRVAQPFRPRRCCPAVSPSRVAQ